MTVFECRNGHRCDYYEADGFQAPEQIECHVFGCIEVMRPVVPGDRVAPKVECVCSTRQLMVGGCPKRRGKACVA